MPRKNPGKNQRKMTEFLTKPDPLSVPEYLRAHPYQEGLRYLKALRKGCQITETLDQVKRIVEDTRKQMVSRPYDKIDLHEKFDRQERILKCTNGSQHLISQMLRNRTQSERARVLKSIMENLLRNATDVSIIDLEWYVERPLPIPTRRRYGLAKSQVFVEQCEDGGVKPIQFAVLICDSSASDLVNTAANLVNCVEKLGGKAAIKLSPDTSAGTLNVVVGGDSSQWNTRNVKLHSSDLITDAMDTLEFLMENTTQYEI